MENCSLKQANTNPTTICDQEQVATGVSVDVRESFLQFMYGHQLPEM